jgi:DNA primase
LKKKTTDSDTIKELIKDSVDIEGLLSHLGVQISGRNNREIRGTCPVHGGDNPTSFCYRKKTKTWICFSHGCHETCGRDSIGLVMGVLQVGFKDALVVLSNLTGIPLEEDSNLDVGLIRQELEKKKAIERHKRLAEFYMPPEDVTEDQLETFVRMRTDYFNKEENGGFPDWVLEEFEIGGCYHDAQGYEREIIPIRDEKGELVAYSGRALKRGVEPKYRLTNGFKKDNVLYNLNKALSYVSDETNDTLIIVEGFKGLWMLYRLGFKNCVACMGSRITPGQARLLCKHARNAILMFDGDDAGLKGMQAFEEDFGHRIKVRQIKLADGKSPDEYPVEELLILLKDVPH